MKKFVLAAALAGWGALAAGPAVAEEDGAMVGIHELRREGNRICMADHFHYGNSTGQPSKKAAEVAAARDWAGFTGWEYGLHWGNWNIAGSRGFKCTQSGVSWGCEAEARPCKPGGGGGRRR